MPEGTKVRGGRPVTADVAGRTRRNVRPVMTFGPVPGSGSGPLWGRTATGGNVATAGNGVSAESGAAAPQPERRPRIIVGVDGSDASIAALRVARALAEPLSATVEAWACWDVPAGYGVYLAVGIEGFKYAADHVLQQALADAFEEVPPFVHPRLVRGRPGPLLIDASRQASLLVVGRRGHGNFVPGSVSTACVSHAHCPVLVVHAPATGTAGDAAQPGSAAVP